MVEPVWNPRSPLNDAAWHNHTRVSTGISIEDQQDFKLFLVMTRRGRSADVGTVTKACLGSEPPKAGQAVQSGDVTLIWSGPDQFLVLASSESASRLMDDLRGRLDGIASCSDQSHGRCWLRVCGPSVREMLAKISSLDLHPSAFPIGAAAATSIEHTAVNFWRSDDTADGAATFNILAFASFASSVLHTIVDASREFNLIDASSRD